METLGLTTEILPKVPFFLCKSFLFLLLYTATFIDYFQLNTSKKCSSCADKKQQQKNKKPPGVQVFVLTLFTDNASPHVYKLIVTRLLDFTPKRERERKRLPPLVVGDAAGDYIQLLCTIRRCESINVFQADLLTSRGLLLHWLLLLLPPSSLSRDSLISSRHLSVSLRGAQQFGSFSLTLTFLHQF